MFGAFYYSANDRENQIETIRQKWGGVAGVTGGVQVVAPPTTAPTLGPHRKWLLPHRALTPAEEDAIIVMVQAVDPATELFHYRGKVSLNKVIAHVYKDKKNGEKIAWVKAALVKGGLLEGE